MLDKIESIVLRNPIPFYGSYAAFLRAMTALKERGLPKRLNGRSFSSLLGDEGKRIGTHFGAMGWVDKQDRPSDELVRLVESFGTEAWKDTLSAMVRRVYVFVPEPWEDLESENLREAFLAYTQRRESQMIAQAETFFLSLALACGVQLTERLYFRAERAHNQVGKRSAEEEEGDKEDGFGSGDAAVEKSPGTPAIESNDRATSKIKPYVAISANSERISAILTLSTLLGERSLTDHEVQAIRVTLSVLGRTNAA
jgi:hypothetical protein